MANEILAKEVKRAGGVKKVAKALSVTPSAVYWWIAGKREPSEELLRHLGLRRVVRLIKARP